MVLAENSFRRWLFVILIFLSAQAIAAMNPDLIRFFSLQRTYLDQSQNRLTVQIQPENKNYRLIIRLHGITSLTDGASPAGSHTENILVNGNGQILSGEINDSGQVTQLALGGHDQVAVAGQAHIPTNTFHPLALALVQSQGNIGSSQQAGTNLLDSFAPQPAVFQGSASMQSYGTRKPTGATLSLPCRDSQQCVTSAPGNRRDYVFTASGSAGHNSYTVKTTQQSRGCKIDCTTNHAAQVMTTFTVGGQTFTLQENHENYASNFWLALMFFVIASQATNEK